MDNWERGSHARGVYPTQYTLIMRTTRVEQEEGADTKKYSKSIVSNKGGRNVRGRHEGEYCIHQLISLLSNNEV